VASWSIFRISTLGTPRKNPSTETALSAQSVPLLTCAHAVFGTRKNWLRETFHSVSPKHLQRTLDGFVFRFDRRWREGKRFGFASPRAAGRHGVGSGC
jgi:hypothetical protein